MTFTKRLDQLTEMETIQAHIAHGRTFTEDRILMSTLHVMEMETRHAVVYQNSNIILPLLGSFAILDQVGTSYMNKKLPAAANHDWSGVKKALYYFMGFAENSPEINVFWALRNGVVHNASLVNLSLNGREHSWFRFDSEMNSVVKPPQEPWSGQPQDCADKNLSTVNTRRLVDSISQMLDELRSLHDEGALMLVLPGGKEELAMRFLHSIPRPPAS
jgi:hypothetical protein